MTAPPKPFAAAAVRPSRILNVIGLMRAAWARISGIAVLRDYENVAPVPGRGIDFSSDDLMTRLACHLHVHDCFQHAYGSDFGCDESFDGNKKGLLQSVLA